MSAAAPPPLAARRGQPWWAAYWNLLSARMKEMFREREVIFWIFVFPLLLAVGLGVAFRKPRQATSKVAVVSGPGAAQVLRALGEAGGAKVAVKSEGQAQAMAGLQSGNLDLVVIPPAKPGDAIRYFSDPERPETWLARERVQHLLQTKAGRRDVIPVRDLRVKGVGSRYIDFLIPGLLGMNLMNSGMWGVGFAIVEMRQRKLLKRFAATPMRRSDFLLSLVSSRLILMVIDIALLLGCGVLVFHIQVRGSLWTIALAGMLGAFTFAGLGLLTASRAQKIESVSGLINTVMMPMWIFSGVFFSYQRFPAVFLPLIRLLPLTALNDLLRAVILQGAPLSAQLGRIAVMLGWSAVTFLLALRWFRWR